jgi:hypothetical protein
LRKACRAGRACIRCGPEPQGEGARPSPVGRAPGRAGSAILGPLAKHGSARESHAGLGCLPCVRPNSCCARVPCRLVASSLLPSGGPWCAGLVCGAAGPAPGLPRHRHMQVPPPPRCGPTPACRQQATYATYACRQAYAGVSTGSRGRAGKGGHARHVAPEWPAAWVACCLGGLLLGWPAAWVACCLGGLSGWWPAAWVACCLGGLLLGWPAAWVACCLGCQRVARLQLVGVQPGAVSSTGRAGTPPPLMLACCRQEAAIRCAGEAWG